MRVTAGSTDVTTYFKLKDAAGAPVVGQTITDLDLQYVRAAASPVAKVDATALAAANSAHGDNQAFEVDGTDQPGLYRVDWPDAAFATGVPFVVCTVKYGSLSEDLLVQLDPPALDAAGVRSAVGLASNDLDTQLDDLPTNAELATALGTADDAVLAAIADLPTNAELATALASADDAVLAAIGDLPTNAELATALAAADDAVLAAIAALNNLSVSDIFDTVMTEAYAANGDTMNLREALYSIQQSIQMFDITGTDKVVRQLDGSTEAFTITHDSSTAPTSATRT